MFGGLSLQYLRVHAAGGSSWRCASGAPGAQALRWYRDADQPAREGKRESLHYPAPAFSESPRSLQRQPV